MAAPRLALSVVVLMLAVIALTEGMRGAGPKKCCFRFNDQEISLVCPTSYVVKQLRAKGQFNKLYLLQLLMNPLNLQDCVNNLVKKSTALSLISLHTSTVMSSAPTSFTAAGISFLLILFTF
uniref:Chemokine interleukin-8-like domain-containing protein n=1 Tax=Neolamprologus brichardi TaxID=32507 RepID=A0A3Q4I4J8_NEOBR